MISSCERTEYSSRTGASLWLARRWRSIARKGTIPEPPATSSTGPGSDASHTK